ncbi:MAG: hypothetical protein VKJ04_04750 [Vampirovibrionales bacterium]|nr:hypothetical protein [Vampirovibrionales bacterium]
MLNDRVARGLLFTGVLSAILFFQPLHAFSMGLDLTGFQAFSLNNGKALLGKKLPGKTYTFVAIGFNPARQKEIELWMEKALLLNLNRTETPIGVLEMAIVEEKYKTFRAQIEPLMKRKIENKTLLPRVYAGYANHLVLKKSLGIPDKTDTYYLLCDPQGRVLWKTFSPFNKNDYDTLREKLLH